MFDPTLNNLVYLKGGSAAVKRRPENAFISMDKTDKTKNYTLQANSGPWAKFGLQQKYLAHWIKADVFPFIDYIKNKNPQQITA